MCKQDKNLSAHSFCMLSWLVLSSRRGDSRWAVDLDGDQACFGQRRQVRFRRVLDLDWNKSCFEQRRQVRFQRVLDLNCEKSCFGHLFSGTCLLDKQKRQGDLLLWQDQRAKELTWEGEFSTSVNRRLF